MKHHRKLNIFQKIAGELNVYFDSTPVLYGSLGLAQLINGTLEVDDIDILIESSIFRKRIVEIYQTMAELKFELINKNENEFFRDGIKIGLATDGDMYNFAKINPTQLKVTYDPVKFRTLTLHQYLLCYEASSKDGYRRDMYNKKDDVKIKLIKMELDV